MATLFKKCSCNCATTADPCVCGTVSITCSTRGGTAVLCGKEEFVKSVPPKKYRNCAASGSSTVAGYVDSSCAVPTGGSSTVSLSGAATWSATTCAKTQGAVITTDGTPAGFTIDDSSPAGVSSCQFTVTQSATSQTSTGTGSCCPVSGHFDKQSGSFTLTLSVEDTEFAALTRLLIANPWTDYFPCLGDPCCRTTRQIRGALQYSLEYIESRFKLVGTGTPGASINLTAEIWRRVYGVGDYVLYQTYSGTAVILDDGTFEKDAGVISNDAGYETVVRNAKIVP